jgi:hypothetical protein
VRLNPHRKLLLIAAIPTLVILVGLSFADAAISAQAPQHLYGAIAMSVSRWWNGFGNAYDSQAGADQGALNSCSNNGITGCQVVARVVDGCLASADDGEMYVISDRTDSLPLARASAMAKCRRGGLANRCKLGPSFCTGDDTARFYGTWTTRVQINGQSFTLLTQHDAQGYHNVLVTPTGNVPFGAGTFSAAFGHYQTSAPSPNDTGTYRFTDSATAVCTNAAGITAVWKKQH